MSKIKCNFGNCLAFEGNGDSVQVSNTSLPDLKSFAVSRANYNEYEEGLARDDGEVGTADIFTMAADLDGSTVEAMFLGTKTDEFEAVRLHALAGRMALEGDECFVASSSVVMPVAV